MENYIIPRWLILTLGISAALLFLLLAIGQAYGIRAKIDSKEGKNTISISAQGSVMASPDTATVRAGLYLNGNNAVDVQNQATEKINNMTKALKSLGVEKENITTSQFSLYPRQSYEASNPGAVTGYTASQQVTVKVKGVDKDTDKLSKILASLTDNGANQINGIELTFDDPDNIKGEARKKAVEKAKEKAKELADATGVKLGKVVSLSEGGSNTPGMPAPYMESFSRSGLAEDKAVAPDVQVGSQEIQVIMTLTFEIK